MLQTPLITVRPQFRRLIDRPDGPAIAAAGRAIRVAATHHLLTCCNMAGGLLLSRVVGLILASITY